MYLNRNFRSITRKWIDLQNLHYFGIIAYSFDPTQKGGKNIAGGVKNFWNFMSHKDYELSLRSFWKVQTIE